MGLHTGEPLVATTGYVGMDVHRAARIAAAGHGGQILLSGTTSDLVSGDLPDAVAVRDLGAHRLKDLRGDTRILQVEAAGLVTEFPPLKTTAAEEPPPTPGEAPYRGLQAFEEEDADLFFGRDETVTRLVDQAREARFVALIGASGSGKSSILRAGLIPHLRHEQPPWQVHLLTPTAHPLEALAVAVAPDDSSARVGALVDDMRRDPRSLAVALRRRAGGGSPERGRVLIAVDQLEEVFTLCRDEEERAAFLANLIHACGLDEGPARSKPDNDRATVVITLRADFYAFLAPYPPLRDASASSQLYVGTMSSDELRQAIEEPARRGDWEFVPGLVDLLLRDVGDEPGALPLLSHALLETWRRRRGTTMTLRSYAESGGVKGAIARTADRVYEGELSEEQRPMARDIFVRLTELGEGTQDTRRRARLAELLPPDAAGASSVRSLIGALADARLVTVGEDDVEVAHEALIREWPTLREWLRADREGLRTRRRIADAAAEWEQLGRDDDALLRGARLAEAVELVAASPDLLNDGERRFVDASRELQTRSQAARDRSRRRVTTLAFGLSGVFLLVAAASAVLWFRADEQRAVAEQRQREADEQRRIALSRQLATQAVAAKADLDLSALLSLEALRAADTVEARASLVGDLLVDPRLVALIGAQTKPSSVVFSPDGKTLVWGTFDGRIVFWDLEAGKQIGEPLKGHADTVNKIAFSPDGKTLATGGADGTVVFWDPGRRERLGEPLRAGFFSVDGLAFSPDGRTLASVSHDTISFWDVPTRQRVGDPFTGPGGPSIVNLAFSPDGRTLASAGCGDHRITLWDVARRAPIGELSSGTDECIIDVAFSPDGRLIASGGTAGIAFWDAQRRGQVGDLLNRQSDFVSSVAFSPDGTRLISGSGDGTVVVWDVERREAIGEPLAGHFACPPARICPIFSVAFSPDGRMIAATGNTVLSLWEPERGDRIGTRLGDPPGSVSSVVFSPDGHAFASAGDAGITLWDPATRVRADRQISGEEGHVRLVAFSPDGKTLGWVGDDGRIVLWDLERNEQLGQRLPLVNVNTLAFSPDDRTLVAGGAAGQVILWDVQKGEQIGSPVIAVIGNAPHVRAVAFSPDGRTFASAGVDAKIILWDVQRGEQIGAPLTGHTSTVVALAFSPDGRMLASAGEDRMVMLWDVERHERIGVPLAGHTDPATGVAFSPDGRMLASSGLDGKTILWDVERRQQIATLPNAAAVTSLAFNPDGSTLASGGSDGTVSFWDVSLASWRQMACEVAGRNLTQEEWERYLGTKPYQETCPGP
jgi:WD40 repeat protein/energy-coupling factor transporter ATP-binding protein EcfA2